MHDFAAYSWSIKTEKIIKLIGLHCDLTGKAISALIIAKTMQTSITQSICWSTLLFLC